MIKNVTRYKLKRVSLINRRLASFPLKANAIKNRECGHVHSQAIFFIINDAREKERMESHSAFDKGTHDV